MSTERQAKRFDAGAFLASTPVFTLDQLRRAMGRRTAEAAKAWVKYQVKTGRLRSIERALYTTVPAGVADPSRYQPDRFLVAAAVRPAGIFSYHAALELLGAAHAVWHDVVVVTKRRRKPIILDSSRINFQLPPAALASPRKRTLGTRAVPYSGLSVHVTGPERTLVEGFRYPRLAGGLPELVESAAGFASLDFDTLRGILAAYGQKRLFAAVGWFLERYRQRFFVPDDLLRRLARRRPSSPQYLPRDQRKKGGVFVNRWNLVLPDSVVRLAERDEG
jgi:predicted transcriptional regulator of viral defense system